MKILENILFYISVPKCASCGKRLEKTDLALCPSCRAEYDNALLFNCSICSNPYKKCTCTNEYLEAHFVHKHIKLFRYFTHHDDHIPPTNALIYSLKRENRADVLNFLSSEIAESISASIKNPENYIFTAVPRRKVAIIKYGYDHAHVLAKSVAKKLGAKYIKTAYSLTKKAQKKAEDASERIINAKFELIDSELDLSSKNVILIDDVVTTGASIGYMATLLKGCGAKNIVAASLAMSYRDKSTHFDTNDRFSPK